VRTGIVRGSCGSVIVDALIIRLAFFDGRTERQLTGGDAVQGFFVHCMAQVVETGLAGGTGSVELSQLL
jgi:hypothetical protein